MKQCARCNQRFPFENFYLDRRGIFSARCKSCHQITWRPCIQCGQVFEGSTKLCSSFCRSAHRPVTFKNCEQCGCRFGPVSHLNRRFCSMACKVKAQTTGCRTIRKTLPLARTAQNLLRYHIQAGHIRRPNTCEECGATNCKIEGAHFDYHQPLWVRWLCRSCHVRWDKRQPKGGTYAVPVTSKATATGSSMNQGLQALG